MNHLLFANDCLIFIKAELQQLSNLKQVLISYEKVGGQKINKSEFMVTPNIDAYMTEIFKNYLGMCHVNSHSLYLGLPLVSGVIRKQFFRGLEKKMARKVNDWKNKMLSWTGREVLIKSCLQAIPQYAMF